MYFREALYRRLFHHQVYLLWEIRVQQGSCRLWWVASRINIYVAVFLLILTLTFTTNSLLGNAAENCVVKSELGAGPGWEGENWGEGRRGGEWDISSLLAAARLAGPVSLDMPAPAPPGRPGATLNIPFSPLSLSLSPLLLRSGDPPVLVSAAQHRGLSSVQASAARAGQERLLLLWAGRMMPYKQ